MKQYRITGYHATDQDNVNDILKNGFIYSRNSKHWLGNGVYFYLDSVLAEWWTTKPSKRFGSPIKNKAIVKCTFKINEDNLINLRRLDHYNFFMNIYMSEYLPELIGYGASKPKDVGTLRCSVCDYIAKMYNIHAIIGVFNLPHQPYLPKTYQKTYNELKLLYPETQLCIFDQNIIEKKEIL